MRLALREAARALQHGDVPVGAVVVRDGEVIVDGCNEREHRQDPTAHAEMLALREAARALGGWRLLGCVVYVTLEPCSMCAGAIVLARVPRIVYGRRTRRPARPAASSTSSTSRISITGRRWTEDCLPPTAATCSGLLQFPAIVPAVKMI